MSLFSFLFAYLYIYFFIYLYICLFSGKKHRQEQKKVIRLLNDCRKAALRILMYDNPEVSKNHAYTYTLVQHGTSLLL